MTQALISIENLSVGFRGADGTKRLILRDVSVSLAQGETLGLVGESGSGKSTLGLAVMGYLGEGLEVFSGRVLFEGHDMFALPETARRKLRGKRIALIPQSAGRALTPTLRIRDQIDEALRLHTSLDAQERKTRLETLLREVRLPSAQEIADRYPHQLSGGQLQRVAIAMALGSGAKVLILDEPTTGLDVTTQAHILTLLKTLARESGVSMIIVSHDLAVIAQIAQRIAVMYAGEIVEDGTAHGILSAPAHPYPRALIGAIPRPDATGLPTALEGVPPMVGATRLGCAFAPRCPIAAPECHTTAPPVASTINGTARCLYPGTDSSGTAQTVHARADTATDDTALQAHEISVRYDRPGPIDRVLGHRPKPAAVAHVDLKVNRGETLGLVGESGSGKSTILRALSGLLRPSPGRVEMDETPLPASVADRSLNDIQPLQMVFQDADSALNPRQTIRDILEAPLRLYFDLSPDEIEKRLSDLLRAVRLPDGYLDRFPGQLSGGEKQRIGIARAFAAGPSVVLCDEVTSALDVSVQAAVLRLLAQLQKDEGTGYVFVSHDLAVVRAVSDQIAVLYQGRLCEIGPTEAIFAPPFHPYTEVLLGAILMPDPTFQPILLADDTIDNAPPAAGCPFQNRCPHKLGPLCDEKAPPEQRIGDGHRIHCHMDVATLWSLSEDDRARQ